MRGFNRYAVLSVAVTVVMLLSGILAEAYMSPGRDGGFMMKRLLRGLDLSAQEEQQIKAIVQEHQSDLRAGRVAVLQARLNLLTASTGASFDASAVQSAYGILSEAQGRLTMLRAETFSQVMAVLTPEQQSTVRDRLTRVNQRLQKGIGRLESKAGATPQSNP
ncbi:MAG: Spy/CpxP family protein refolding chaperone [Nitrospiraceae bacterium]|nr:Spy/CpxP family protein refolding chaperone [Nitrospiraceae bacterium]